LAFKILTPSQVEDFSFIPLDETAPGRLKVTVGISGWITKEEVQPSNTHVLQATFAADLSTGSYQPLEGVHQ
jgi:hypothetical protein